VAQAPSTRDTDSARTLITYDSTSGRVTQVQGPDPQTGVGRPSHTYSYGSGRTDVWWRAARSTRRARSRSASPSTAPPAKRRPRTRRGTAPTSAIHRRVGQTDLVATSIDQATGLESSTNYDNFDRALASNGPAPKANFDAAGKVTTPSAVPTTTTAYEDGVASLNGLAATY
jgi:hypothetical protein